MKRVVCSLIAGVLLTMLGVISCQAAETGEDVAVGVLWTTKSSMVNRVFAGFLGRIKTLAPGLKLEIRRELKDTAEAEEVFRDFEASKNGIIYFRSSGAKHLGKLDPKPKIPCFVGACNNPAFLGAVKNLAAPEGNITGVTYYIPYEKRFDIIMSLFPNIKSVALLLEKGHPSSAIEDTGTKDQCAARGLEYFKVVAEDQTQLIDGAKKVAPKADLLIISNTRLAMDNTPNLLMVANQLQRPMFSFAARPVKFGAIAGLAADDQKLGSMLADSVVDVLINKKPISQVPVKMDTNPKIIINRPMMQALDLKFPDSVLATAKFVE